MSDEEPSDTNKDKQIASLKEQLTEKDRALGLERAKVHLCEKFFDETAAAQYGIHEDDVDDFALVKTDLMSVQAWNKTVRKLEKEAKIDGLKREKLLRDLGELKEKAHLAQSKNEKGTVFSKNL